MLTLFRFTSQDSKMRHLHIKSSTSKAKGRESSGLDPLLQDIRSKLGSNWTFYQECLDGIVQATTHNQDTTAWLDQMNQLIDGREDMICSHEGVLFLLNEKGIALSGQQRSAGEVKVDGRTSLTSSHGHVPPIDTPPVIDMATPTLSSDFSTPSPPFAAAPISTMRKQPNILPDRINILFFDFTPLTPSPSATSSPQNTRHFAILNTTSIPISIPPELDNSADPVFFTDSNFKQDVDKFFGTVIQSHGTKQTRRMPLDRHDGPGLLPPYVVDEDDLCGWRKRVERSYEVKSHTGKDGLVVLTDGKEELDGLGYGLLEDTTGGGAGRNGA